MLTVEPGPSYRGETYISCGSHPTAGRNNGWGRGAIFSGMTVVSLAKFLADHAACEAPDVAAGT